jgi:glycosyltransferase involved in cell wall biosynthesis
MASKVPCVSTNVGDAQYILGDSGYIIPVKSYRKLALFLIKLLSMDFNKKLLLGNRCRERVLKNFSIDSFIREYEDLYLKEFT